MSRIDAKFAALRAENQAAFVSFTMAGDPDYATALQVMRGLPGAGVDIIELGMPFTDPMADGPSIQLAGQRALEAGMTLKRTLEMVRAFRKQDDDTPIILMSGYTEERAQDEGTPCESVGFLQKPFTLHDLRRLLRAVG